MIAQGFKIQWDGSVEYIRYDLAGLKPSSKIIPTIDFRAATETEEKNVSATKSSSIANGLAIHS